MDKEVLDLLGKEIIEKSRDEVIEYALNVIESKNMEEDRNIADTSSAFSGMTDMQREAVRSLVYEVVDTALHNFLYTLEYSKEATLCAIQQDNTLVDLREIASGDLQGYLFIWAEKFSKQPLTHEPLD